MDGIGGGEVLEVEVGGVSERGFEGADGEAVGFRGGDFIWGDGAQRTEEVEVGFCVFAGFGGDVGDFEEEPALVFFVCFPGGEPGVEVFELRPEEVEGGGGADDAEDGEEDVVANFGVGGEDVEDCG